MSDLPHFVSGRHGGTGRWQQAPAVSAAVHMDRGFRAFTGQLGRPGPLAGLA
jgi:hypothetical protein